MQTFITIAALITAATLFIAAVELVTTVLMNVIGRVNAAIVHHRARARVLKLEAEAIALVKLYRLACTDDERTALKAAAVLIRLKRDAALELVTLDERAIAADRFTQAYHNA